MSAEGDLRRGADTLHGAVERLFTAQV